jgi:hypothetical protein
VAVGIQEGLRTALREAFRAALKLPAAPIHLSTDVIHGAQPNLITG